MRLKCFFILFYFHWFHFFLFIFLFCLFVCLLVYLFIGLIVHLFICILWLSVTGPSVTVMKAPSLFSWWWLYTVTAQAVHYEWIHLYATQCQERPVNLSCSQVPCLLSTDIRTFTFRHSFSLPVSFSFSGSSDYAVMCFVWRIYAKLTYINPAL